MAYIRSRVEIVKNPMLNKSREKCKPSSRNRIHVLKIIKNHMQSKTDTINYYKTKLKTVDSL